MNKNSKKAIKISTITLCAIVAVIAAVIALAVGPFLLAVVVDNAACASFEDDVLNNLSLPDGAMIAEYQSACGNTGGTGDHTELCVALIIESDIPILPENAVTLENAYACTDMSLADLASCNIHITSDIPENGYILVVIKNAPMSALDIRGC